MLEVISAFWSEYGGILLTGTRDTLVMVLISTLFAYLLGLPLGVALTVTQPHGICPSKTANTISYSLQVNSAIRRALCDNNLIKTNLFKIHF